MCLIFEIFQTTKQLYNHVQCGHRKRHSEFNHQTPGINPGKNLGGHNMFHHLLPQTDLLSYMTIVYPGSQLRFQSGPQWITSICGVFVSPFKTGSSTRSGLYYNHFEKGVSRLPLWWTAVVERCVLSCKWHHP